MYHRVLPGIEVITGGMFSGKTEELLRRVRRAQIGKQKTQLFKPVIDDRYSMEHIQSHDNSRLESRPVRSPWELLEHMDDNTRVVGVDEVQFFDDSLIDVAQKLAYRGIRVILAGLDLDYRGRPFGPIPKLMAVAESVTKLSAICVVCAAPATRTQRIASGRPHSSEFAVGGKDMYEARCRFCHEPDLFDQRQSLESQPLL